MRTQFNLANPSSVHRARVYVVGLGAFVLNLAGSQVGDHYCDPPEMAYPKRTASVVPRAFISWHTRVCVCVCVLEMKLVGPGHNF